MEGGAGQGGAGEGQGKGMDKGLTWGGCARVMAVPLTSTMPSSYLPSLRARWMLASSTA